MELRQNEVDPVETVIGVLQRQFPQRDPGEIEAWVRGEFVAAEFAAQNDPLKGQFIPTEVRRVVAERIRSTTPGGGCWRE